MIEIRNGVERYRDWSAREGSAAGCGPVDAGPSIGVKPFPEPPDTALDAA